MNNVKERSLSKDTYSTKAFVDKYLKGVEIDMFHIYVDKPAMHKALGNVNGKRVLCMGSGGGQECAYIMSKGAKSVIGIDISKEMVPIAAERYPKIEFREMPLDSLKFPAGNFDILYSDLAIHYLGNMGKVFREAFRVLKPKGRFVFSTIHPIYGTLERKRSADGRYS